MMGMGARAPFKNEVSVWRVVSWSRMGWLYFLQKVYSPGRRSQKKPTMRALATARPWGVLGVFWAYYFFLVAFFLLLNFLDPNL